MTHVTPAEQRSGTSHFLGQHDTRLFYRWTRPDSFVGHVIVVHGAGEHSGRYAWLAEALTEAGFGFYAFDHRGQGRSRGRRADVLSFSDYSDDVALFMAHLHGVGIVGPYFLYGHSMGAAVVAEYAARQLADPAAVLNGIVLASVPARIGNRPRPVLEGAIRVGARLFPLIRAGLRIASSDLSTDPAVVRAAEDDPLRFRRVTVRWGVEMLAASDRLPATVEGIRTPVLMLQGESDVVALAAGTEELSRLVGSEDHTLITLPGLRHELHNAGKRDREVVFRYVVDWLHKRARSTTNVGYPTAD